MEKERKTGEEPTSPTEMNVVQDIEKRSLLRRERGSPFNKLPNDHDNVLYDDEGSSSNQQQQQQRENAGSGSSASTTG